MKKFTPEEKLNRELEREKRKSNQFIERFSLILILVLLIFCGITMFAGPKDKLVLQYDKLKIEEDINKEEPKKKIENDTHIRSKLDINEELSHQEPEIKPNNSLSYWEKRQIADIKRKKIQEILKKRMPQRQEYTYQPKTYEQYSYNTQYPNHVQSPKTYTTPPRSDYNYNNNIDFNKSIEPLSDIFKTLIKNSSCEPDEIEYILKLYYKNSNTQPLTLIFRKENDNKTSSAPEIIYATLPNNKWQSLQDSFENIMDSLLEELINDTSEDSDLTRVRAMITTPCSQSQYISQSFIVSSKQPELTTVQGAEAHCTYRNGRLPDILELISIFTHKKNMPRGYYLTNSMRLSADDDVNDIKPLGDYVVIQYIGNNLYFTSSSKLPNNQVYTECVLK